MARSGMHTHSPPTNPRQCKSHDVTNCVADPMQLFRIRCVRCNYIRDFYPDGSSAAKYLYYRRHTRSSLHLLTMATSLSATSASYLTRAASECGIVSETASVTIAEGIKPNFDHGPAVRSLRKVLELEPTAVVAGFRRVPCRTGVNDLIVADLALSPSVKCFAQKLFQDTEAFSIPQFPFHIALGTCSLDGGASQRAFEWANATIRGAVLILNSKSVRVLPPSKRKSGAKRYKSNNYNREHIGLQKRSPWQQQCYAVEREPSYRLCPAYSEIEIPPSGSNLSSDAESTSATSSLSCYSYDTKDDFPGLLVDLTFLDEIDNAATNHAGNCISSDFRMRDNLVQYYQKCGSFVLNSSTSIWTQNQAR